MLTCDWCGDPFDVGARYVAGARYCRQACRQAAYRCRRELVALELAARPKRLGYADPPYPGHAAELYANEPSYAGEVDHAELIERLADTYDGWALSTSADALRELLPLCPRGYRLCSWIKPHGVARSTLGLHNVWEPLIVWQARRLPPGVPDALVALPARGGGQLPGRKPLRFCTWMFQAMGAAHGDTLADLYPGTGIVGRAWRATFGAELSAASRSDGLSARVEARRGELERARAVSSSSRRRLTSRQVLGDASAKAFGDVSAAGVGDGSAPAPSDASAAAVGDSSSELARIVRGPLVGRSGSGSARAARAVELDPELERTTRAQ